MTSFLLFALLMAVSVATTLLKAFVLTKLWSWYLVAGLGFPALSMGVAFGLSLIVSFLTLQYRHEGQKSAAEQAESIVCNVVFSIVYALTLLLVGWIGTSFL